MGIAYRVGSALGALFAKDAGGAPLPTTGFLPTLGSTPSAAGVLVSQGTAISVSAVYACVTIRAQDRARCTPRLFYEKPKSGTREQIFEHDLVELFKRPNRQQTWFEWCEQMSSADLMRGNAYAALKGITKRGAVGELIPINPDAVLVMEGVDGGVFYSVNRIGLWQIAMLKEFPPTIAEENIFHLRGMSFNALVGASTIHVARDGIGVAMGLEQQAARWLANAGRPSVVLQSKKSLTEGAAKRLKAAWNEFAAGLQNTGNAVVLEDGLEAKPLSLTSTDIAFIEQRKFSIEDICRFWRVPPFKLGATELRGIDIEEITNDYVSGTIMPDLHRTEQKFEQVFDLDRQNISVDFDERVLLRAATKTRYANYRLALGGASWATINEVRAAEQMPGIGPEGDQIYQPSNLAAAGSDVTGTAPDGAGRPEDGHLPAPSPAPAKPAEDQSDAGERSRVASLHKRNGNGGFDPSRDTFGTHGSSDDAARLARAASDEDGDTRKVLLIRHGATKLNNDDVSVDRIRGWKDIPLSDDGKEQAGKLAESIAETPPDYLFASDLKRASETADIIANACGMDVTATSKKFRPWNVGVLAGCLSSEAVPVLAEYACDKPDEAIEGGESFNAFRARFFAGLADVLSRYEGRVAIVTHHRCERLVKAWAKAGFPDDGGMDLEEFTKKGEATGSADEIEIPVEPLNATAAALEKRAHPPRMKFVLPSIEPVAA